MIGTLNVKNKVLVNRFFSVLSIDILVKASSFLLLPLFLRVMTQSEFGLYNYVLSIVQTFSLVLNLGLYVAQTKLYHSYTSEEQKGQLLFSILVTLFVFLILLFSSSFLFGFEEHIIDVLFKNGMAYKTYSSFIMFALVVSVFAFMLTNFFYTSEKIRQVKSYNTYRVIFINAIALSGLYLLDGDAVSIRLAFTFGIELLMLLVFSTFYLRSLVFVFNKDMAKKSLKMGLPIMLSAVFGIVVNFSDKYLLQKYGTLIELSNYYLAFSFASIIPLIFASVQNVWLPIFMKEKDLRKNLEKTKGLLIKLFLFFLLLSLGVWILFDVLLWMKVIPIKYSDVVWILPLLLFTQIFAALTTLLSNYLIYFERTGFVILSGLVVSGISIVLGFWIIPVWGVLGAALTTLAVNFSYLIIDYYVVLFLKQKFLASSNTSAFKSL